MTVERYRNRCVAFIDILGFKGLVDKSVADTAVFDRILGITSGLAAETTKKLVDDLGMHVDEKDIVSTAFSDSIVISVRESSDPRQSGIGHLYAIMVAAQDLCRKLLIDLEVLARGGIARGAAYHRDELLFGPAIIDAYNLEQNIAKFARIAVAPQVAQQWANAFGRRGGLVALNDMVQQDVDGIHFLDVFHFPPDDSIDRSTGEFFRKAGPILGRMLADGNLGEKERSKIKWAAGQYNGSSMLGRLRGCASVDITLRSSSPFGQHQ